jgi:hypothetical protein
MACEKPAQEWTIDVNFKAPADTSTHTLVFCLSFDGDGITGNVEILSNGVLVPLSSVTGTNRVVSEVASPSPTVPVKLMTLSFTWGTARVVLSGNTFPEGAQNQVRGHVAAFAAQAGNAPPTEDEIVAPSDGDKGTVTGTQTT